ncbi:MAG: aldehyde dehydrogenase family protein [Planctomycetota bacterium JB042]
MQTTPSEKKLLFLAGRWEDGEDVTTVTNPFSGAVEAEVARAGSATVVEAVTAALAGFQAMRRLSSFARSEILRKVSESISDRREEFARTITRENGKPIRQARTEVERATHTFRIASEEATRVGGEIAPLDLRPGLEGRFGLIRRVPLGPVLGIAPFNFPLNLVAHKVAPALAAGCSIVLKPASRTPLSALLLAEVLEQAGLPPGGLSVLPCRRMVGDLLVQDERFRALSFTGSPEVGFGLKAKAGKKPVVLELGGNAAVVVHEDADLEAAVRQSVTGAFAYAGQVCISVQRVFVHEAVADEFTERFVDATEKLVVGDPLDEKTDVGPLIDDENAARVESWIEEARARGARVLTGGSRQGRLLLPTVLEGVDPSLPVDCAEAFGPVVNLHRYADFADAIDRVNRSRYGLQAGVFTRDLGRALSAFDELEVGGVILNDAPTFRVDSMPYGGTKDSGIGREGVKYAVEHFTEPRLLVVNPPPAVPRDGRA